MFKTRTEKGIFETKDFVRNKMEVENENETTENEPLVRDIRSHYILHWNYRGYRMIPNELLKHGSHIEDLYFKENGLEQLPGK